jgi:hypothetical protein
MSMLRPNPLLVNRFSTSAIFVHISHFFFFYFGHFFTLPLHQIPRNTAGDIASVVGEVVVEVEKNPGADEQVQHLSHFFISVISYLFLSQSFLHCPSIKFLKIVLATLQPNPVR